MVKKYDQNRSRIITVLKTTIRFNQIWKSHEEMWKIDGIKTG